MGPTPPERDIVDDPSAETSASATQREQAK